MTNNRWLRAAIASVALGALAVVCAVGLLAVALWREAPGWLAFSTRRDGNWEIVAVRANGSDLTNLTDSPAWDWVGAYAPDGERIAFLSNRWAGGSGELHVMVMDADGANVRDLTPGAAFGQCGQCGPHLPLWSPDGRRIAFVAQSEDGARDLYIVDGDGGPLVNLTGSLGLEVQVARWSPGGGTIGFSAGPYAGGLDIYLVSPDGGDLRQLTDYYGDESLFSWSPEGDRLVIVRSGDLDGDGEWDGAAAWLVGADGSGATQLLPPGAMCGDVIWSPVGETIAYQSLRDGDWEVYAVQSDGSGDTQLTDEPGDVVSRLWGWSPDGRWITFLRVEEDSNGDGDLDLADAPDVWVMDAGGGRQANVSDHAAPDVEPSWRP